LSFRKIKELTHHGATPIGDVQGVKSFLSLLPHTPAIHSWQTQRWRHLQLVSCV